MRDKFSHAIHSLFGIVAVNGILLILPGTAYGAFAPRPSDGTAHVTHLDVDIAANLGCALTETVAVSQDPSEGQDGPGCTNRDGSARECTPSENIRQCADDLRDAFDQCMEDARDLLDRIACGLGAGIDGVGCVAEGLTDTVLPIKKVLG